MKSKTGFFAGSFDPPTLGHLNLIERAAKFCDHLYVGIAVNSKKRNPCFTTFERQAMLAAVCHDIPHLKIIEVPGLVIECAKHCKADFLIRGLRSTADYEKEFQLAHSNKKLGGMDTLFLLADPQYAHISATLINEIALGGYRLHQFVPPAIEDAVYTRITLKPDSPPKSC